MFEYNEEKKIKKIPFKKIYDKYKGQEHERFQKKDPLEILKEENQKEK